jgi:predicted naringenin-chalcone synthase
MMSAIHGARRGAPLTTAYLNRVATAVPPNDVHRPFVRYVESLFSDDARRSSLLSGITERAGIEHRYSFLAPNPDPHARALDAEAFYVRGDFPNTAARMRLFEARAPALAAEAIERLVLGDERNRVTHLLITCCTGFSAPGLDLEVVERCRLPTSVERTMIGFMGCYAAINALKLARHIVRSEPNARVLVVNLELCTLHFKETTDLSQMICFLLFADGCAASLVTAEANGIALDSFRAVLVPQTRDLMAWHIRDFGFDMVLSAQVPAAIHEALRVSTNEILAATPASAIDLWAVHPGGRSILDAVQSAFDLKPAALSASRNVLRCYGNMSSATVMFVLQSLMSTAARAARGCAMSFGPGLIAETMLFRTAG